MKEIRRSGVIIKSAENSLVSITLGAMVLLPFTEILSRLIFRSGLTGYDDLLKHITLWASLLAALIATREQQHISFGFSRQSDGVSILRRAAETGVSLTGAVLSLYMTIASLSFLLIGFAPERRVTGIPIIWVAGIIPLVFLGMTLYFLKTAGNTTPRKILYFPVVAVAGLLLAFPAILNLLYLGPFMPPIWMDNFLDFYYQFFQKADLPLILVLAGLTFYGLPIFLFLGGTAIILFAGNWGVAEVLPNELYNLLTGASIPAIPLFTLTGFILSQGKAGNRLVNLFQALLGRIPGGLSITAILICAFFTTFTGASGVTILALGGLLAFILIDTGGYSEKFTKGLLTSSGSIGLLFPPSLPIIMYAVIAQISVKDMFLGGLIPGTLLIAGLSIMGIIHNYRRKKLGLEKKPERKKGMSLGKAFKNSLGDLLLPVIILLLYFGGITTLVETGAAAVVYVLILEVLIFRELKWKDMKNIIGRSMPVIGGVLIILAMAKGLSYFIVDAELPAMLTNFLRTRVSSPLMFLLMLNIVLLATGCLMDIYSAIMVVAPLIIPLGELYGIHPVQLGIIFLANLQLGYLTPPVGMNLFLASYTFKSPINRIYRDVVPFLLILLVAVLLISYVPWFSTALLK